MSILDFVLLGFLLVTLAIGLKKGFAKMISSGFCVVAALVGSVVAALLLTDLVKTTTLFLNFQGTATRWFTQPFMQAQISSHEQLAELLSSEDAGVFSVLGGIADKIFLGFESAGVESLGGYLGHVIASCVVAFVIWLVSYLALKYILLGLKKLIRLISGLPVLKSIDKIVGAVVSVAFGYIVVFGLLYSAFAVVCANFFPDLGAQVVAMVNDSMFFSYVHHTNFIGELLCDLFQVNYATFSSML